MPPLEDAAPGLGPVIAEPGKPPRRHAERNPEASLAACASRYNIIPHGYRSPALPGGRRAPLRSAPALG
ncbi:hypothetical protein BEI_3197 [Halomonas beimenensis]|uniref:Uncharacterized protein n=1 Tax=Halomonas beimenensis TaxID=475662 RepID=A0A291PBB0_9GAMM|nr:hypothetical protein BEI_3197 [Halomonas beimenensis]